MLKSMDGKSGKGAAMRFALSSVEREFAAPAAKAFGQLHAILKVTPVKFDILWIAAPISRTTIRKQWNEGGRDGIADVRVHVVAG